MYGLKFFSRTSSQHIWNLASFHSPHCMCWSWIISFHRFSADEGRVWPLCWSHRDNTTIRKGLRLPWLGIVNYQRQMRPMPYRELYRALQDRLSAERYEKSCEAAPSSFPRKYTVIDGGASLH